MAQLQPTAAILQLVFAADGLLAPVDVSRLFESVVQATTSTNPAWHLTASFKNAGRKTLLSTAQWLLNPDVQQHLSKHGAYWAQIQWLDALEAMLNRGASAPLAFRFAAAFAKKKPSARSRRALTTGRQAAFLEARHGKTGRPVASGFSVYHDAAIWAEYCYRYRGIPAPEAVKQFARDTGQIIDRSELHREHKKLSKLFKPRLMQRQLARAAWQVKRKWRLKVLI